MDGFSAGTSRKQVYILATTNRPRSIDPALLRPGRFDHVVYVGLPDEKERCAVLKAITKNGTSPPLASDVSLEDLARRSNGFS